jgi:hypothetical protein
MAWILYALCALVVLALLWPKLKVWIPKTWQGTVTGAIDQASHAGTDAVLIAAEQAQLLAGWEADDLVYIDLVHKLRVRRQSWSAPPLPTENPPSSDYALETLRAQVAALTRVVASQSVSVPPAASVSISPPNTTV